MAVPIDSSRPYRWPSELVALVEAVMGTDPNNESTWIEWKSTLDLNDKSGHRQVAKHVLGFANRSVTAARLHAGGHAYLIVGAEPGNLAGVEQVDPAVLHVAGRFSLNVRPSTLTFDDLEVDCKAGVDGGD